MKKEKFPNTRKPLTGGCVGSFEISEGNITGRGNTHTHTHTHTHTQNTHLTATHSGELAQTLAFATREQGLNREALVACLG